MNNKDKLETISCILCRNDDAELLPFFHFSSKWGDVELKKCRVCGLIYQSPRLPEQALEEIYDEDYFEGGEFGGKDKGRSYFNPREQRDLDAFYTGVLRSIVNVKPPPATLLEVGCAGGHFLLLAKEKGYAVKGIEISKYASEQARSRYKLDVQTGTLEQCLVDTSSIDIVYLKDILEHVRNPLEFLRACHRILTPDGLLVILIPNYINSPLMRFYIMLWQRSSRLRNILWSGRGRYLLDKPFHLFEFIPQTAERLVNESGFDILKKKNYTRPPIYSSHGFFIINIVRYLVRWLYYIIVCFKGLEGDRLEYYCRPK